MISRLEALDVRFSAEGERLRINAPKGTLNTALREQIARSKDEILVLLRRAAGKAGGHLAITRIPDDQPSALSFAQERLWFLQQLQPESAVYNLCRAVRISGPLNLEALESGLNEIQRRHESLRTKFITVDGRPLQIIAPAEELSIAPVDLRGRPKAYREKEAGRLIANEAKQPFDLTQGRLLRIRLLRLGKQEHVLGLMTHHIAADAWSMGILMRELWAHYENHRAGKASRPAELPCRYRDYAVWQRGGHGEALEPRLDYWRKRLADVPVLDLPVDRPRPRAPTFRGARVSIELPESLTAALEETGRREGATLFMTLLAAFQLLLRRYTGQVDIAVGAPVANRERGDLENIIGLFVDTLVLRTDLAGTPSFRELLSRVREVCLGAYGQQAVPFELLVRELSPQRELTRHPLFQAMLVLQNTPGHSATPAGLSLEPVEIDNEAAQFDLSLYLRERRGRLIGFFEYATDLFERTTIERMAGHLRTLLQGIVADPDQSAAALPLLSAAEQKQLLVEWNDTAAKYPMDSCIHEVFEAQASRTPDAVALEFHDKQMTYRELNSRANGLARELQKFGVGPERSAGVLAERSLETIVGVLATLKAGGAYVPLDPHYPKERLAFMLADAGAGVLLAQKKFAGYFPDYPGKTRFIDDLLCGTPGNTANLPRSANIGNPACVIYTSGSTGTPKGVVALHRGAINRFNWMWKSYPFGRREKSCQKTSLSFVDSVWEIFGALLQGVPTVLVPDSIANDPRLLVGHLAQRGVTRMVLVPSLLNEIIEGCPDLRFLAGLRYCFSSGEALSADLAARFRRALPACRLINLYGSSEVAGDVAFYEVTGDAQGLTIPIGRPIGNSQMYLLDDDLLPVPVGARGEIYVGGDNLARGYLNRPELTAQKFVANPFSGEVNSRLYRTGDLARYRADGNIELVGRSDHQVKIRGCRVELGEVEAALGAHPAVRECLVTGQATESGTGNRKSGRRIENPKSLVAYVVPRNGRPSPAGLRSFLKEKLPDYMLPSGFVFLGRLPLLPNGKVDRAALPPPGAMMPGCGGTVGGPRTEIELLIAEVWRQVLKLESFGVDDNFFELGGHSLMAAEIAAKLRDTFDCPVALRDLFEDPTVAGLARAVEERLRAAGPQDWPPIRPVSDPRDLPLSSSQESLFVLSQLFGGGDFLNMPYAYRLDGALDRAALHRSIQEIVRRHAVLRAGFRDTAAGPTQFVRRSATIKLSFIDLARVPKKFRDSKLERISRQDAAQTFDLETAPLLRIKVLRLAATEHILLVTMHHIITDQWSMDLFRRELAALYEAFSKGLPSPLPELRFQFTDFVRWQRQLLRKGFFKRQIDYWRKQLGAPAPLLSLGRGVKRKMPARYHSSRRPIEFDGGLLGRIKAFARKQSCTPFMIFVAALDILLHRYTGQRDIRIGTLVANRGRPGTDGLIGFFVNAVVLRTHVKPSMSFADVIEQVRATCVAAYAHQDLPFEYLETLLEKQRDKRGSPPYQVMLNYRNQTTPNLEASGLTIASWNGKHRAEDPGIAISRLDVNFHLRELSTTLTGAVTYKADLFDDAAIAKFLEDYCAILEQIISNKKGSSAGMSKVT